MIKGTDHPQFGKYKEIFALRDLEPFEEVFVVYGDHYWDNTTTDDPVIKDAKLLSFKQYTTRMQEYQKAILALFKNRLPPDE